ncbi:tRNA-dependent cyclodipeptide synthase [Chitinophaga sp. CF418]|uniref:tRNA-dependent cyclodipeptide synthase n=1 Tax=Chitinophaga sp. CF418 TaxID=1855287 RepID=UPI0009227B87|nr:tRNA-dependent cyclodipeptide synthase [Chitinophaga sp. CF418]SHL96977.1 tRNA-dependent cyclodipeptide synthase [Chitinophaga sp. CF418]
MAQSTGSKTELSSEEQPPLTASNLAHRHYEINVPDGSLRILPLLHSPALQVGWEMLNRQPLVLLGMSPGNAFFTRKRIEVAISAMAKLFDEVHVLVPDTIAAHTYRALGYSEQEAIAKAKRNGQNIKNRCLRAMERARIESPLSKLRMLDWDQDIATLPGYEESYANVCHLFDTNEAFRRDALDKGRSVLAGKLDSALITEAAALESIQYLLKEFAYMAICRNGENRDIIIPYHQDFALGHGFCDGQYQDALPGLGWVVFEIELTEEKYN